MPKNIFFCTYPSNQFPNHSVPYRRFRIGGIVRNTVLPVFDDVDFKIESAPFLFLGDDADIVEQVNTKAGEARVSV